MMSLDRNDCRWVDRTFFDDIAAMWIQRRLAWSLYLANVAQHRRSSGLGLFAPFISVLVHVALLGAVMALVFNEPVATFIPFFAVSFSIWQCISTFISDSAHSNEKVARYLSFPDISGYIVHLVTCYEFVVSLVLKIIASFLVVMAVNPGVIIGGNYIGFLIGAGLLCVLMLSWALPCAYFFDRFRLLRGFLPQFLFAIYLMTPILWNPDRIESHRWVVDFNPVFHVVETVRSPLLTGSWSLPSCGTVLGLIVLGTVFSRALYSANRKLVIYGWVA